jgi:hypothetical protein
MSDLGHGAICACPACRVFRARQNELAKQARCATDLVVLTGMTYTEYDDLKLLARAMGEATDDPKGDDLI